MRRDADRVDYGDDAAGRYVRGRALDDRLLTAWFSEIEPRLGSALGASTVVDLGAGTGAFSRAWSAWGAARVIGVEPSLAMLAEAAPVVPPGVSYVRAVGERLPLVSSSVDVAWLSTVFHHFDDAVAATTEIRRVLRVDGRAFVRGYFPDHSAVPWLDHFPGADRARSRFPTVDDVVAIFSTAGFELVDVVEVEDPTRHTRTEAATWVELMRSADSLLIALTDDGVAAGIEALRELPNEVLPPTSLGLITFA